LVRVTKTTWTKSTRTKKTRTEITSHHRYRGIVRLATSSLRPLAIGRGKTSFAVFMLLGCLAVASAQTASQPAKPAKHAKNYAVVFGTVWDAADHPVYGVHVHLRRVGDKKPRWEAYSDHQGEFSIHVPAGKADYELWGDLKSGKFPKNIGLPPQEPVAVHIDFDERTDVSLHLTNQ
jgi:hypothetical protein